MLSFNLQVWRENRLMVTVIVHQRGAYMNIDGGVISVDPPPCLGRTNLPADKQSRRTSIETMLTIVRRSISSNILETSRRNILDFASHSVANRKALKSRRVVRLLQVRTAPGPKVCRIVT